MIDDLYSAIVKISICVSMVLYKQILLQLEIKKNVKTHMIKMTLIALISFLSTKTLGLPD